MTNLQENQTLELLAEKAKVEIDTITTGKVRLSKVIKSQTVNIPVTLNQEILVIDYVDNVGKKPQNLVNIQQSTATPPQVMINGETFDLGDNPIEVVLSQQIANVAIETLITEQVSIKTQQHHHEQQIPVTLRHEELHTETVNYDELLIQTMDNLPQNLPK